MTPFEGPHVELGLHRPVAKGLPDRARPPRPAAQLQAIAAPRTADVRGTCLDIEAIPRKGPDRARPKAGALRAALTRVRPRLARREIEPPGEGHGASITVP